MQRIRTVTLAILIAHLLVAPAVAQNSTPQMIKVQGFLSDKNGGTPVPANGTFAMTFALYDAAAGGLLVDNTGPLSVDVTEGLYEVELQFSTTAFDGNERYIAITVRGETLSPRIRVVSAPFAYVAETLDGFEGTDLDQSEDITVLQGELANLQGQLDDLVVTGGNTLDEAYHEGGAGAGRHINADNGPVEVSGSGGFVTEGKAVVKDQVVIDLSQKSGSSGRDAIQINASDDNTLAVIRANKPLLKFWYVNKVADVAHGALTIDLTAKANMAGRNAMDIHASDQWNQAIIALNKPELSIWSNSENKNARLQVGELQITGGFSGDNVAFIAINKPKLRIYSDSEQKDARLQVGVLEISGGADLAEPFSVASEEVIPDGAVLVIDEANPGQLRLANEPYDTRVAGVVSGAGGINPGLTLSQDGIVDGELNVAMAGRVYCLATASNGPIQPGDRLTTSAIPGHAMKVTDRDLADGATLGKAMSPLGEGEGLVLVLVGLQ